MGGGIVWMAFSLPTTPPPLLSSPKLLLCGFSKDLVPGGNGEKHLMVRSGMHLVLCFF